MAAVAFNFNGRRRKLAPPFRNASTAKEAARSLGVETGSVFGLIQRMTAEGILEPLGEGEPTRGTEYVLTRDASHILELEPGRRQEDGSVGTVDKGQRMVVVKDGRVSSAQAVFGDRDLSLLIAWA